MPPKRKSVTFHETVSQVCPGSFDGSSSPVPITTAPATAHPSLQLDPMYLTWLRTVTKAQYPFIVNGTFAQHVYHQNFDKHYNMKHNWHFQRVKEREAAVPALADKYGSLGWGSLYDKVTEEAWVKNYREIYRFDGSDEQLLAAIAKAYIEIKRTIAEEVNANTRFTQDGFISSPLSDPNPKWEAFTQAGGALVSPDFGPSGFNLPSVHTADTPFEKGDAGLFRAGNGRGNGDGMVFDVGVMSRGLGDAMVDAE